MNSKGVSGREGGNEEVGRWGGGEGAPNSKCLDTTSLHPSLISLTVVSLDVKAPCLLNYDVRPSTKGAEERGWEWFSVLVLLYVQTDPKDY